MSTTTTGDMFIPLANFESHGSDLSKTSAGNARQPQRLYSYRASLKNIGLESLYRSYFDDAFAFMCWTTTDFARNELRKTVKHINEPVFAAFISSINAALETSPFGDTIGSVDASYQRDLVVRHPKKVLFTRKIGTSTSNLRQKRPTIAISPQVLDASDEE